MCVWQGGRMRRLSAVLVFWAFTGLPTWASAQEDSGPAQTPPPIVDLFELQSRAGDGPCPDPCLDLFAPLPVSEGDAAAESPPDDEPPLTSPWVRVPGSIRIFPKL